MASREPDRSGSPWRHAPIDDNENRWTIGTPAVPDVVKRTLTALVAMLLLFALLYLLAA